MFLACLLTRVTQLRSQSNAVAREGDINADAITVLLWFHLYYVKELRRALHLCLGRSGSRPEVLLKASLRIEGGGLYVRWFVLSNTILKKVFCITSFFWEWRFSWVLAATCFGITLRGSIFSFDFFYFFSSHFLSARFWNIPGHFLYLFLQPQLRCNTRFLRILTLY